MAKGKFNLKPRINDDAEYRAFMTAIAAIFTACGFIQTADTNQVNLATAVRPGQNQRGHYQMWRFNDALQATAPLFIKITFGTSPYYAEMPSLWIQIGTATQGNGELAGKISVERRILQPPTNSYNTTEFQNIYTGGAGNRLAFWLFYDSQWISQYYYQAAFIIERTKDAAGEVTGEGVAFFSWQYPDGNNGQHTNQMLMFADPLWSEYNNHSACGCYLRDDVEATFYLGKVAAFPVYPCKHGGLVFNPLLSLMAGLNRDYAHDVTVQIEHYGTMRTFLKMSYGAYFWGEHLNWVEGQQRARTRGLILWED